MAAAAKSALAIRITAEAANAIRGIETVHQKISALAGRATMVAGALSAVGVALGVDQLVEANRQYQSLGAGLESVLGSVDAAGGAMDALKEFARQTPYELDQVVQGFIALKARGLDPSIESLRAYGNIAAAMPGKSIQDFVEAVADAVTGENERLKEFGIKASVQGEQIAYTFQGVTTVVANNAQAIEEYLRGLGELQFAGAMEKQMDTLGGAMANLKDTIFQTMVSIGEGGFNAGLVTLISTLESVTASSGGVAEALGSVLGSALTTAAGAIRFAADNADVLQAALVGISAVSAAATMTSLTGALLAFANPVGIVAAGIAAVAGGLYYFRDANVAAFGPTSTLRDLLTALGTYVSDVFTGVITFATTAWESFRSGIQRVADSGAWQAIVTAAEAVETYIRGVINTAVRLYMTVPALLDGIISSDRTVMQSLGDVWSKDFLGAAERGIASGVATMSADLESRVTAAAEERRKREAAEDAEARRQQAERAAEQQRQAEAYAAALRDAQNQASQGVATTIEDKNNERISGLRDELDLLKLSERDRFIEVRLRQLSADATAEQRAEVRELAGRLYDEQQAAKGSAKGHKERKGAVDAGAEATAKATERLDELIARYRLEREEMAAMSAAYETGSDDIVRKTEARLAAERQLKDVIADLTPEQVDRARKEAAATADTSAALEIVRERFDNAKRAAQQFGDAAYNALEGIVFEGKNAKEMVNSLMLEISKSVFRASLQPVTTAFGGVVQNLISGMTGGGGGLNLGGFFGGGRALGGPVEAGVPYLVGEAGRELFVPTQSGMIVPNHRLGGGGGAPAPVININISTPNPRAMQDSMGQISARLSDAVRAGMRNR